MPGCGKKKTERRNGRTMQYRDQRMKKSKKDRRARREQRRQEREMFAK